MIKTFTHKVSETKKRDTEVNEFAQEHGSWSTQTNICETTSEDLIITTVFYGKRD